jgi:hypothetical protein
MARRVASVEELTSDGPGLAGHKPFETTGETLPPPLVNEFHRAIINAGLKPPD